jgi:hypothetical protein
MQEASPTPIERFERDGYLVVRNALPDPVLQPIKRKKKEKKKI